MFSDNPSIPIYTGRRGDLEPRHWSNLSWAAAKVNAASLSPAGGLRATPFSGDVSTANSRAI